MNKTSHIFKIFTQVEWAQFCADGVFKGSAVDTADGYIHISAAPQVQSTLDTHYTTGEPLVLASIDPKNLQDHLKWEVSRDGMEFPHYYASLEMEHIEAHYDLSASGQGRYDASKIIGQA